MVSGTPLEQTFKVIVLVSSSSSTPVWLAMNSILRIMELKKPRANLEFPANSLNFGSFTSYLFLDQFYQIPDKTTRQQ